MTKRIVEMNLRILQAVMKQPSSISLHPVILFGALLGIVRDNRLLEWNNDVELGVADINWNEESIQDLISGLKRRLFNELLPPMPCHFYTGER